MSNVGLIVPTLNAGIHWKKWLDAFEQQVEKPKYLLIVDSSSDDETVKYAKESGFQTITILRQDFDNGGTRQHGVDNLPDAELIVFLTQDAILEDPKSLQYLVAQFEDPDVGMAYGRQLPHHDATPMAAHARYFNYSSESRQKTINDIPKLGIKTIFCSNSFAAYRCEALQQCGGFPSHIIFGEDTYIAAKMLQEGWKIAYCAEASVYHSHNYTSVEEARRYFDIGVLHSKELWLLEIFGNAKGEGLKYIISELHFCLFRYFYLIPSVIVRAVLKFFGYKLGQKEKYIPNFLKAKLSMNPRYWQT